jgi:hypothetical protein
MELTRRRGLISLYYVLSKLAFAINPPTHPVCRVDFNEVDEDRVGSTLLPTAASQNQEKSKESQQTIRVMPKLKSQHTPNSDNETIAPAPEIPPELEATIVDAIAPIPLNQNLRKQVLQVQSEVVLDAVALVKQQKAHGKAKNPAGLLVKAIQNNWKPNPIEKNAYSIPDDFNEWFDLARKSGLAIASSLIDGVLCVYTNAECWEPYEDFRAGFSLPWLRKTLGAC